jgi:signal transduction histidine kinase
MPEKTRIVGVDDHPFDANPTFELAGTSSSLLHRIWTYSRFKLASVGAIAVGLAVIGPLLERVMTTREINQTARTVAEYVGTIVGQELQDVADETAFSREQIERLNNLARKKMLGKTFAALKIRGRDGRILYSSAAPSMIGLAFPDDAKMIRAWHGEIAAGISTLEDPENAGERHLASQLMEVYLPIYETGSDRIITVAEFFIRLDDLQGEIDHARRWSWATVALSMLAVYLILARVFRSRADATIERQAKELQNQVALLTEAMDRNAELDQRVSEAAATVVTLNERDLKRIGAEVHDGPLQDLSLALMRIDNIVARAEKCALGQVGAESGDGKACNAGLVAVRDSLERALKELRGISSGLGVPGLAELTLRSTLKRAVRDHERNTASTVKLNLDAVPSQLPLPAKITVYRVVREALNNAFHHAGGVGQEVRARIENDEVVLEVVDSGPGFDVAATHERLTTLGDHLGLVGMRERIESLGGKFSLDSKPGEGTIIRARLSVDAGKTSYV